MADEIIVRYKAEVDNLVKGLNEVKTEVKTLQKENDTLQKKLGKTFDEPVEKVKSLKTQLKELKAALANATDPKEVERLARAAGELADRIGDASDAAKVFASESKFEQVGNAFGSVVSKVKNLDFKGALDQSKLLLATSKSITFKDAIVGLKEIGGTLKNLGQAILTNPLFLIGGAIAAAVNIFNDLEDASARVNKTYADGLEILKQSKEASEAYRKAARDLAIENELAAGKITELEANKLKAQNKYQDEYKKLLKERQQREKEAIEQAAKDREEDGFRRTKDLYEWFGGETDATKAQKQKLKDIETAFNESVKDLNGLFREEDEKARIADNNKKLKEEQELNKKLIEEQERLAKVLRDLRTQNLDTDYERRKQTIINNFEDEEKKYKGHNDIIVELVKKRNRELVDLDIDRENKNKKILEDAQKDYLKIFKDGAKNIAAEDVALGEGFKNRMDKRIADEKMAAAQEIAIRQGVISAIKSSVSSLNDIMNNMYEARLQEAQTESQKEIETLDSQFSRGLITKEQYEDRKTKIERKYADKSAEIKREQYQAQKNAAVIGALINTAEGVAGALAQTDQLGYAAFVLAALVAAAGALQVAAIESQPTPKFEKGGWIGGKRHSQGGTLIEAEKDEFVVNRKSAKQHSDLLEAINDGVANEFIQQRFIAPMLKEQERKFAEQKQKNFADNIINSMMYNSAQFKDSNLLESLKRSRQADRENVQYLAEVIKHNMNFSKRAW